MAPSSRKDYSMMLRIPTELKQAIEKKVGQGKVSEFLRIAAEERLKNVCSKCHGTGRLYKKIS